MPSTLNPQSSLWISTFILKFSGLSAKALKGSFVSEFQNENENLLSVHSAYYITKGYAKSLLVIRFNPSAKPAKVKKFSPLL